MRPAFSSPRHAAAFAFLLGALLALPYLLLRTVPIERLEGGSSDGRNDEVHPGNGPSNDVDMAFLGSSRIWVAVNTPYVQKKLSEHLGRKAEVFTMGWSSPGYDKLYFTALSLLEHRRVHTLVIYPEPILQNGLHWASFRWWSKIKEDPEAMPLLTVQDRIGLYGAANLAIPKFLLGLVRQNQPIVHEPPGLPFSSVADGPSSDRLGARSVLVNHGGAHDFSIFKPVLPVTAGDVLVYSAETRGAFTLDGQSLPPLQLYYARKLARLCLQHGTKLVILKIPLYHGREQTTIPVDQPWQEFLDGSVAYMGIASSRLFAGMTEDDLRKLFYDDWHLNQNGQDMFSSLITPVLIKLYAEKVAGF